MTRLRNCATKAVAVSEYNSEETEGAEVGEVCGRQDRKFVCAFFVITLDRTFYSDTHPVHPDSVLIISS